MSRPYNFFQFAESGNVSAYPSNFSGFFTPLGMVNSPDGFLFIVDSESVDTKATYSLQVRGEILNSGPDQSSTELKFSGSFYPVNSGTASIEQKFTGSFRGDSIDNPTLNAHFSGDINRPLSDNPVFDLKVTGKFLKTYIDSENYFVTISGGQTGCPLDFPTVSFNISGNFIKYEQNRLSLSTELETITWSLGNVKLTTGLETGVFALSMGLDKIFWSRAGS